MHTVKDSDSLYALVFYALRNEVYYKQHTMVTFR